MYSRELKKTSWACSGTIIHICLSTTLPCQSVRIGSFSLNFKSKIAYVEIILHKVLSGPSEHHI